MMHGKRCLTVVLMFLMVCSAYAQGKIERAVKEIKEGSVKTHVIPMVDDVWGEIDGWVRSPYRTIYPQSWSKNKSVLSDGDSFIHFTAVRMKTKSQRDETANTFNSIDAHRGIAISQDGEYISSSYLTTSNDYPVVRITLKKRKGRDVAYMDIYFIRVSRNLLISATSAVAGSDEKALKKTHERYGKVFDYMVGAIDKR